MTGKGTLQYASIVLLSLICYSPAIPNSNFVFDDFVAIVRNDDVTNTQRPLLSSISQIFRHDFWGFNITDPTSHKSYRPLVILTFNIEYRLFEGSDFGMPSVMKWNNLMLHCFVCCLLFSVWKHMFRRLKDRVLLLGTLLFAVHPIHTEAVSGIVGRAELMCFVFYLGAIRVYCSICTDKRHFWLPSLHKCAIFLTLTGLALLCKEIGITVLPLCAFYDILMNMRISFHRPTKIFKKLSLTLVTRLLVLFAATLGFIVTRLYIADFQNPKFKPMDNPVASADSFQTRALSQNYLYALNAWLLLCPNWLCFDWSFDSIRLVQYVKDIRLVFVVLFYIFILLVLKSKRTIHFIFLCLVIPFLPASGIIRVGFVVAERILYIPSAGFCLLISFGWEQLCNRHKILRKLGLLILIPVCAIFMLKTAYRSQEWMNESALFNSALKVCPNNAKVYYNIGRLASYQNNPDKALIYYQAAIRLYPEYDAALMNLGNLYRGKNNLDLAEKYIQQSIQITEDFPAAWMNLGIVKASKGLHGEALNCYSKALKYRKRYANCYYNMGNLYVEMNNTKLALQSWVQSLAINSKHSPSWVNILTLMDSQEKHLDVEALSTKALKVLPNDPGIMFLRANAMGKLNRYDEAEKLYKLAIAVRPNHAIYHVNLGVLYHRWNRKPLAVESYKKALAINPNLLNVSKYLMMLRGIRS